MGVWAAPTCLIGGSPCHCFWDPGSCCPSPHKTGKTEPWTAQLSLKTTLIQALLDLGGFSQWLRIDFQGVGVMAAKWFATRPDGSY